MRKSPVLVASLALALCVPPGSALASTQGGVAGQDICGSAARAPGALAAILQSGAFDAPACESDDVRLSREAQQDYDSLFGSDSGAREGNVRGLRLNATADEAKLASEIISDDPPSNWPSVARGCDDVLCALTRAFGNQEAAERAMIVAKRDGYIISLSQKENGGLKEQVFSLNEVRMIDQTLRKLPPKFKKLQNMREFFRVADGLTIKGMDGYAAFAEPGDQGIFGHGHTPGDIVILPVTFKSSEQDQELVVAHELAHEIDFAEMLNHGKYAHDDSGYADLSGWHEETQITQDKNGKPSEKKAWVHSGGAQFPRAYSSNNPMEDWADGLSYYVIDPGTLKRTAPKKYDLIRDKVFDGWESKPAPWPGLDAIVSQTGGMADLLRSCLGHADLISAYQDQAVFFALTEDKKQMVGFKFDSSACFSDKAEAIARSVPELCNRGGLKGVQEALHGIASSALQEIERATTQALLSNRDEEQVECVAEKNLTSRCPMQKALTRAFEQSPDLSMLSPQESQELSSSIASKVQMAYRGAEHAQKLQAALKPEWVFMMCLGSLDTRTISYAGGTGWIPYACEKAVADQVAREGWQFDSDNEKSNAVFSLVESQGIKDLLKSFATQVLPEYHKKTRFCLRDSCRTKHARELVSAWVKAQGFAQDDQTQGFIENMAHLIR